MTNVIVCTSINGPTEAIRRYDSLPDWKLVVIGDKKTPVDYTLEDGLYVSPEAQEAMAPDLSEAIGWNCIQRRNFGFIIAQQLGADLIAVVDDDNIPLENWGTSIYVGREVDVTEYVTPDAAFDPIGATNYPHLWHRGFPLQLLPSRDYSTSRDVTVSPSVQADFWNGDPDIDAICRMEHRPDCRFDPSVFPFTSTKMGPFNSQNTIIKSTLIPDYFLFPHVGRMDDIWASYYVQALGHRVIYGEPTVYQDRNEHDLVKDMKAEYLGYEHNNTLVSALAEDPDRIKEFLPDRSVQAWDLFRQAVA
jgi:hypothetical protein